ncbi:B-cell receptor CD22 [Striga asiatica]|uniref:B-cell receptor CD22 n=1 Tax=Striga asiatica TaxID=4170 RepID=A0A5A7Q4K3_STRAF|nr:B-cell receptor CD22 [Striga asiatica]
MVKQRRSARIESERPEVVEDAWSQPKEGTPMFKRFKVKVGTIELNLFHSGKLCLMKESSMKTGRIAAKFLSVDANFQYSKSMRVSRTSSLESGSQVSFNFVFLTFPSRFKTPTNWVTIPVSSFLISFTIALPQSFRVTSSSTEIDTASA